MKKRLYFTGFVLLIVSSVSFLVARSFRVSEVPNGNQTQCATCHVNPAGGGARNDFGQEVENNFLTAAGPAGHVEWGPALAALDSDNDGFTNGEELQDPNGTWETGQPAPGDPDLVTNPGDPSSHPEPNAVKEDDIAPGKFFLANNYPNPFNPSTTIRFGIPEAANVKLEVYDATGRLVDVIENEFMEAGNYNTVWNARDASGRNLSSGVYIYRISAGNFTSAKRMILLK